MFTICRTGNIRTAVTGNYHCGVMKDFGVFKYEVKIKVTDNALDARGFVVDNLEIGKYFEQIKETSSSCELLARDAARYFYRLLGDRKKHCLSIFVRVWGTDVAFIDYEWKAGDPKTL